MISLGTDHTLDGIRAFANAIRPGAGAMLTEGLIRQQVAGLAEVSSIDGLDSNAPTYVLVVDDGAALKGAAVVGKVRNAKAVAALGAGRSVVKNGWAIVGAKPLVQKLAPYALASLPALAPVTSPTAVVYMPQVLARYQTEIAAGREQFLKQMAVAQGSTQMAAMTQSVMDGMFSFVTDSEQVIIGVDVTKDIGAIDVAMTPKASSRLATFVSAQHPSDYGLLARLPANNAPILFAGHIDSGPYHDGLRAALAMMYGQGAPKEVVEAMATIMNAATGEFAMAGQMAPKQPMAITQLFSLADQKVADKSIDRLLALFKGGVTFDAAGIPTTIKSSTTVVHDGVRLKGYDVTYDLSKLPAQSRAAMEAMVATGKPVHASIATFDRLGLATMGGASAANAVDAARGKGRRFTPPPMLADFLIGSRARKESFLMAMDVATFAGIAGAGQPVIISAGFADQAAHLRFALPAATAHAFTRPGKGAGDAIAKMASFRDQMCKCVDKVCADGVVDDLTKWGQAMAREGGDRSGSITGDDAQKMAAITEEMTDCMTKAMTAGTSH